MSDSKSSGDDYQNGYGDSLFCAPDIMSQVINHRHTFFIPFFFLFSPHILHVYVMIQVSSSLESGRTSQRINASERGSRQRMRQAFEQRLGLGESPPMINQGIVHSIRDVSLHFDGNTGRGGIGSGIIGNIGGGLTMFRPRECDFNQSHSLNR